MWNLGISTGPVCGQRHSVLCHECSIEKGIDDRRLTIVFQHFCKVKGRAVRLIQEPEST